MDVGPFQVCIPNTYQSRDYPEVKNYVWECLKSSLLHERGQSNSDGQLASSEESKLSFLALRREVQDSKET